MKFNNNKKHSSISKKRYKTYNMNYKKLEI